MNFCIVMLCPPSAYQHKYLHVHSEPQKCGSLFLTITLANLNRFLLFLYYFNREEILHVTVLKFNTSPYLCAHRTWKN